jgi:hypothetical protein
LLHDIVQMPPDVADAEHDVADVEHEVEDVMVDLPFSVFPLM